MIALWATGSSLGLASDPREFITPLRQRRMLATVATLDIVAIPLVVWAFTRLLGVSGDAATLLLPAGVRLSPEQVVVALVALLVAPVAAGVVLARWRRDLVRWSMPLARGANPLVVVIIALSIARYHHQFSTTFTSRSWPSRP